MIGVRFPVGAENFSLTTVSKPALRITQPHIPLVLGALFLGVKRQGRETGHSPPPSAEVKNACSYTSTPTIRFHGVVLSYIITCYISSNHWAPSYEKDDFALLVHLNGLLKKTSVGKIQETFFSTSILREENYITK
jgi:hypothetical protein